ncbi:ABC transporter substrate-binding protein, partial [bacterium]|nr:ABC transporter substrate-binding protein [bacterium]
MKSRLFVCILALFAVVAASCGSDDPVIEAANDSVVETPVASDDEADASADDATEDDEPVAADDADSATDATADDEPVAADEDVSDVPQRIVSLNPTATEMLFAIGAGDQVVAVDQFSYYPAEAPVTNLSGFDPNIEAIAGFEPDLVVTDFALEGLEVIGLSNHAVPAAT